MKKHFRAPKDYAGFEKETEIPLDYEELNLRECAKWIGIIITFTCKLVLQKQERK